MAEEFSSVPELERLRDIWGPPTVWDTGADIGPVVTTKVGGLMLFRCGDGCRIYVEMPEAVTFCTVPASRGLGLTGKVPNGPS